MLRAADTEVGVKPDEAVPKAERRSVADGRRELAFELDPPKPRRLTMEDVREGAGRSGSPNIGADWEMGEPGSTPMVVRGIELEGAGALYMYVAIRTTTEPTQNASVMG
jgi:hypothetical protein